MAHAQGLAYGDLDSNGVQRSGRGPALSRNGRFLAFTTFDAIDPADTNGGLDVYVRDRVMLQTSLVSRAGAAVGNDWSISDYMHGVSNDGRYTLFTSWATNLVAGDTNGQGDLFIHDAVTNTNTRASVGTGGQQANAPTNFGGEAWTAAMSSDGRYVGFTCSSPNLFVGDNNASPDVFRFDRQTGTSTLVSVSTSGGVANGWSGASAMSADGRYVVFTSTATNLIPGDTNGAGADVFLRDMLLGVTTVVSKGSNNLQAPNGAGDGAISDDGRYVVFTSLDDLTGQAPAWTAVYLRDRTLNQTRLVTHALADGNATRPEISGDGSLVTYESDGPSIGAGSTAGVMDTYVYRVASGTTERISTGAMGEGSNNPLGQGCNVGEAISFDGTVVAFADGGTNLIQPDNRPLEEDVFLWTGCVPSGPSTYCVAKMNSQNCVPQIATSGAASSTAGSGFLITATNVLNNKPGLLFYSLTGAAMTPFQGGFLCVKAPIKRLASQSSGGNPPPNDCSGSYVVDFNAVIASGLDMQLMAGSIVYAQYWSRDPGFAAPNNTGLTAGVRFKICP
jgi:Tol biopolymer transport system component